MRDGGGLRLEAGGGLGQGWWLEVGRARVGAILGGK